MNPRDVVITGIGLVSSLGEGLDAHWRQLVAPSAVPTTDDSRFSPYCVHPLPDIDWSGQIPKRGDQRQMETWQRLGVYAAGLALDDACLKEDERLCATMDMIVAAGGGERDEAVDQTILAASPGKSTQEAGVLVNDKLTNDLRPTLFLAQLSNLLAGNISIVHKVTGSSRTFMGEAGAGVSAIETATARLRSGQSTHVLVGGAYNAQHPDMLLGIELGRHLHRAPWQPLWDREAPGGGMITGSGAAFLVLETREHAEAGGRQPYAVIERVISNRAARDDQFASALAAMFATLAPEGEDCLVISGASGAIVPTRAERTALGDRPIRGIAGTTGWLKEAEFPFAVAIAALAIARGEAPAPNTQRERPFEGAPRHVMATAVDFHRGEGAALLSAA